MPERDYDEGYDNGYRAGMQKMRDLAQARIDALERALTFIPCEDNAEGKLARAALKGARR